MSFAVLSAEAQRLGFLDTHLRTELNRLAEEGIAVRESPLKPRSRWPEDALVRFYDPPTGSTS